MPFITDDNFEDMCDKLNLFAKIRKSTKGSGAH